MKLVIRPISKLPNRISSNISKCPMRNAWWIIINARKQQTKWFRNEYPTLLVSYLICSYVKNKIPRQGQLYISLNHICFYSYMLGQETKLKIGFAELQDLYRHSNIIYLTTNNQMQYNFTILFDSTEAYELIEQLNKMAIQQIIKVILWFVMLAYMYIEFSYCYIKGSR